MSNGKNVRSKSVKILAFIILLIIYVFVEKPYENIDITPQEGKLIVRMLNVGQADCFLLEQEGKTALIDCGEEDTGEETVEKLKSLGITKLDYVFGTHPHDDHMGGMYDIITNFEIGEIIISEKVVTTNWFKKLKEEINNNEYTVIYPEVGDIFDLGEAQIKVVGPMEEEYSSINNYSIVLKVSFGEMDVLMTGDAEVKSEKEILASGQDLEAEILKVGHHGSDTSSCEEWLEAISPEYALISTKVGNIHEHPIKSVMERLEQRDIEVYRTDENGMVTVTITADDISFDCEPGDYLSGIELSEKENSK